MDEKISLNMGNGGKEMGEFLSLFTKNFFRGDKWSNFDNDSATIKINDKQFLSFTSDSFIVSPLEFPGGNIGDLAFCGTVNDLSVMGAEVLGLSLSLVIEEGFPMEDLNRILDSLNKQSLKYGIPIVTGDTKIMEKSSLDKIIINTSGIGISENILDKDLEIGDKIILSGGIAEHGIALLSKRFDFQTEIVSDSKALVEEFLAIRKLIKQAKDPSRGGISASLNELALKNNVFIEIEEKSIPIKKEVKIACNLLGIEAYDLANEGKAIIICSSSNSEEVLEILKKFNPMANIIGEVKEIGIKKVILNTEYGKRILDMPSGKIVPRIC